MVQTYRDILMQRNKHTLINNGLKMNQSTNTKIQNYKIDEKKKKTNKQENMYS